MGDHILGQHLLVKFSNTVGIDGKPINGQKVFKNIIIDSIEELIQNPEKFLNSLTPDEKINPYYTLSKRKAPTRDKESFSRQDHIAFDIDDIDTTKEEETARAACKALGVNFEDVGVVATGNGVQILIRLANPITDIEYFTQQKELYKICCDKITHQLKALGLPGHGDTKIWDHARVLRPPGTWNVKPESGKKLARTLQGNFQTIDFSLKKCAGIPDVEEKDYVARPPSYPDTESILKDCEFIKYYQANQSEQSEPIWYAAASIFVHLENGRELFHKFSKDHPKYEHGFTDAKLEQAKASSGPRTCKNIDSLWSGCMKCKWYKKCKSPILIQGPNYIRTKQTGFRNVTAEGTLGKINIMDVVKFFDSKHEYAVDPVGRSAYAFNGMHFTEFHRVSIEAFIEAHADNCANKDAAEFVNKVLRRKLTDENWLRGSTDGKMNFLNGVLDIKTLEFGAHTTDIGFRSVLPYAYDPKASAPRFNQFLDEVTCGNKDYRKTLLEFGGYCLSNDPYWEHKALALVGGGSNGKSVFVDVLMSLAGDDCSSLRLGQMLSDQHVAGLDGKLFNIADETGGGVFKETDMFKTLTAGGRVAAKVVYKPVYEFTNKAKIILLCNDLPWNKDTSYGFRRRFIIVNFEGFFEGEKKDPFLTTKLREERAGIFNMFIEAYKEMKERRHCFVGEASEKALEDYQKQTNPIFDWFEETAKISDDPTKFVATKVLYDSYINYCEANGFSFKWNSKHFAKELKRAFPKIEHTKRRDAATREQLRGFTGLELLGPLDMHA